MVLSIWMCIPLFRCDCRRQGCGYERREGWNRIEADEVWGGRTSGRRDGQIGRSSSSSSSNHIAAVSGSPGSWTSSHPTSIARLSSSSPATADSIRHVAVIRLCARASCLSLLSNCLVLSATVLPERSAGLSPRYFAPRLTRSPHSSARRSRSDLHCSTRSYIRRILNKRDRAIRQFQDGESVSAFPARRSHQAVLVGTATGYLTEPGT